MPEPRQLGNVARTVLASISEYLEANEDECFEVVLRVHSGDAPAAILVMKEMARRNKVALRAITFLLADRQKDAEEVLITAKLRQKKAE